MPPKRVESAISQPISATRTEGLANTATGSPDTWKTLYRAIPEDAYKLLCEFEDRLGKLYGTGPFPPSGRSDVRFKDRFANTYRFAMLRISELSDEDFKRIFE